MKNLPETASRKIRRLLGFIAIIVFCGAASPYLLADGFDVDTTSDFQIKNKFDSTAALPDQQPAAAGVHTTSDSQIKNKFFDTAAQVAHTPCSLLLTATTHVMPDGSFRTPTLIPTAAPFIHKEDLPNSVQSSSPLPAADDAREHTENLKTYGASVHRGYLSAAEADRLRCEMNHIIDSTVKGADPMVTMYNIEHVSLLAQRIVQEKIFSMTATQFMTGKKDASTVTYTSATRLYGNGAVKNRLWKRRREHSDRLSRGLQVIVLLNDIGEGNGPVTTFIMPEDKKQIPKNDFGNAGTAHHEEVARTIFQRKLHVYTLTGRKGDVWLLNDGTATLKRA